MTFTVTVAVAVARPRATDALRELRERLGQEVRDILKAAQATAILVTHDQHEAFAMADKVGVMEQGRIVEQGTHRELLAAGGRYARMAARQALEAELSAL